MKAMNGSCDESGLPAYGALLGLDYGTKRVGIAVSTPEQTIASPLEVYGRWNEEADAAHLSELVADYRVVGLVVGLPVHMSGDEGEKAKEARLFGRWAGKVTGLPVQFWDERFTTVMANDCLKEAHLSRNQRKARLDKVAAQIMLQSFLDTNDRTQTPPPL